MESISQVQYSETIFGAARPVFRRRIRDKKIILGVLEMKDKDPTYTANVYAATLAFPSGYTPSREFHAPILREIR